MTRVRLADASAAGLCEWGIEAFLRQHGLWRLAHAFGLPKCLLWSGGRYPRRALAAALVRQQREAWDAHRLALARRLR